MSAGLAAAADGHEGRWRWPIDPLRYDTTPAVRGTEAAAIAGLGADRLRRLGPCDLAAGQWQQVRRLVRPLDDAAAALRSSTASTPASAAIAPRAASSSPGSSRWIHASEPSAA